MKEQEEEDGVAVEEDRGHKSARPEPLSVTSLGLAEGDRIEV